MKTIRFRTIFLILAALTLLCLLAPVAVGLVSAALTYDGICHGFTDGSSACTWWQYAQNEIFFGSMLTFSPGVLLGIGWLTALGFWLAFRFQPERKTLSIWQAVLIPVIACFLGACLLSIFPLILRLQR